MHWCVGCYFCSNRRMKMCTETEGIVCCSLLLHCPIEKQREKEERESSARRWQSSADRAGQLCLALWCNQILKRCISDVRAKRRLPWCLQLLGRSWQYHFYSFLLFIQLRNVNGNVSSRPGAHVEVIGVEQGARAQGYVAPLVRGLLWTAWAIWAHLGAMLAYLEGNLGPS